MTDVPPPSSAAAARPGAAAGGLRQRIARAAGITVVGQAVAMSLRLGGNLLIARMLAPDAFGLMGVVIVLQVALTMLSDLGVQRSLVQSQRGSEPAFYDTCWSVLLLRGTGLTGLTLLLGIGVSWGQSLAWFPATSIYADTRLPPLILAMSLVPLLQGMRGAGAYQADRRMAVGRLVMVELLSQLVALVVTMSLAWSTRSHWALLAGMLTAAVASRCFEWLLLERLPMRWCWERQALDELRDMARWVMPASVLGLLALHGERLVLAGLLGTHDFGLYSVAFLLAGAVQTVSGLLGLRVVFPTLSEVARERPADLERILSRFQVLFDLLVVTVFTALAIAGPAVVALLYDARYQAAGGMLAILALGGISQRALVIEQCYLALGQANYTAAAQLMRSLVLVPAILVGFRLWGVQGALAGVALAQFAGLPVGYWFKWRHGLLSWRAEAGLLPALVAGGLLGSGVSWLVGQIKG